MGAVAAHENSEKIAATTQTGASGQVVRVTGATFISSGGTTVVVSAGSDGLPSRAIIGDVVVLFANYTSSSVDLAVVAPGRPTAIVRGVSIDSGLLSDLRTLPQTLATAAVMADSIGTQATGTSFNLALALKIAAALVKAASCGLSISGAFATAGAAIGVAATVCTSAAVSVLTLIVPQIDSDALFATQVIIGGAGCLTGRLRSCVSTVLSLAGAAVSSAQTTQSSQSGAIDAAMNDLVSTASPEVFIIADVTIGNRDNQATMLESCAFINSQQLSCIRGSALSSYTHGSLGAESGGWPVAPGTLTISVRIVQQTSASNPYVASGVVRVLDRRAGATQRTILLERRDRVLPTGDEIVWQVQL